MEGQLAGETQGEKLAKLEGWAENHEKVCASRWSLLTTIMVLGLTSILAVGGWSLNRVFEGQQRQLEELREIKAVTTVSARVP